MSSNDGMAVMDELKGGKDGSSRLLFGTGL
jgi:hypothetical protein